MNTCTLQFYTIVRLWCSVLPIQDFVGKTVWYICNTRSPAAAIAASVMVILITYYHKPILVVVWNKTWFCGCLISAIVNSSPVALSRWRSLRRADELSPRAEESYWVFASNCVWSRNGKTRRPRLDFDCSTKKKSSSSPSSSSELNDNMLM